MLRYWLVADRIDRYLDPAMTSPASALAQGTGAAVKMEASVRGQSGPVGVCVCV